MAKKINFKTANDAQRASNALKDMHVEHVLVEYKHDDVVTKFVIVLNRYLSDAKKAFEEAKIQSIRIKNWRHYENAALNHTHYQPQFDCKCRHCGKTFKSVVKEAVWCSKECKKAFRDEKRKNKTA